ncbi:MAG: hypothetical protein AAEJ53_15535 [Myxococcota bacterium]
MEVDIIAYSRVLSASLQSTREAAGYGATGCADSGRLADLACSTKKWSRPLVKEDV